jgi:hypothetical protein
MKQVYHRLCDLGKISGAGPRGKLWYYYNMSIPMIEQQIPDEAVVIPPLPSWLMPTALTLTVLVGFAIWLLWTTVGPTAVLADPSWVFFCH